MWGDEHLTRLERVQRLEPELAELVLERGFGGIYADPRLTLEERSLQTMSVLAALGRSGQLESHVRAALRLGITKEKISAVFAHLFLYAGLPLVLDALAVLDRVTRSDEASDGENATNG